MGGIGGMGAILGLSVGGFAVYPPLRQALGPYLHLLLPVFHVPPPLLHLLAFLPLAHFRTPGLHPVGIPSLHLGLSLASLAKGPFRLIETLCPIIHHLLVFLLLAVERVCGLQGVALWCWRSDDSFGGTVTSMFSFTSTCSRCGPPPRPISDVPLSTSALLARQGTKLLLQVPLLVHHLVEVLSQGREVRDISSF